VIPDRDEVAAECLRWLTAFLLPRACVAAGRDPDEAAAVLADLRREPAVQMVEDRSETLVAFQRQAVRMCQDLRAVTTAIVSARLAGDCPAAVAARDAVLLLAYRDLVEYALACELATDAGDALSSVGGGSDPTFDGRRRAAEIAVDRWRALDGPASAAFLDLVDSCALEISAITDRA
jgi:hypothetical protein